MTVARTPDDTVATPPTRPDPAAALEDAAWHRLSPRMLLIHPVVEIVRALPALVGVFLAGSSQGNHYWAIGAAGVVAAYSLTRWFTTRLRITADHVQLRHGLLRRKTVTAARNRIRTVDVTSHVLHRLLGLARVVIGTGTNDRKGEGRLALDGLTAAEASALRDDLLHARVTLAKAPSSAVAPAPGAAVELARLDRRWIRYAPFTLSGVLTGLVIWGLYWRVQGESGVDLAHYGPLRTVSRWFEGLPVGAAVLAVLGALVAFVAVTSTAGYVLAFWNFRLVRNAGGTLQVTRGLLTTRATSIERRRLVGAQLSEPLPLRWVGAARTTAIATGLRTGRGAERGGEVLLPPAPLAEAVRVASATLDGTPAVTAELRGHPATALRRRTIRAVTGALTITAAALVAWLAGAPAWVLLAGAAALLAAVPLAADRYRNLGHALVDGHLITSAGSVVRRRATLDTGAIIGWSVRTTFFQRRLGLASLWATTAAGRQGYAVHDIAGGDALALADSISPELMGQFRAARPTAPPATSP